MTVVFGCK